jgi:prolyl-tRNA editing enzyme YbaK/EbsC (Cys-tRNA(Pro) deacylase)
MLGILDPKVANGLQQYGLIYDIFPCEPEYADTVELMEHYGFTREEIVNTILVAGKAEPTRFAACVVLATCKVDVNKKVCQLLGVKRATFAAPEQTAQLTGMMIGGVTVFGLPDNLPVFIDEAVMDRPKILLGGGNRSSKLLLHPRELRKLPNLIIVPGLGMSRS